jgi:hypothetical protein
MAFCFLAEIGHARRYYVVMNRGDRGQVDLATRQRAVALDEQRTQDWWTAEARSWLLGALSLIFAGNVLFSRYLFADAMYDLYTGRYIIAHGLPHRNLATTASLGATWIDQQWLAHVVYYGAWWVGGYPALAATSSLLVTAGFAVLGLLMLHRGVPPARMFQWTIIGFMVCAGNLVIRAQSFAFPCLAIACWLMLADQQAARLRPRTWMVLPVLVLWANTHGSVVVGAGLTVLYAGYRATRGLARRGRGALGYVALGVAAAGTVICTPYGSGILWYYRRFTGNSELRHNILDWMPPSPLHDYSWAFFGMIVAVIIVVLMAWRRGRRPDPLLAVASVLLLAFAMMATRNQAWFGCVGSLLAADTMSGGGDLRAPSFGRAFRRAVAATMGVLALASAALLAVTPDSQFYYKTPVRAIDAAAAISARDPQLRILGDEWTETSLLWRHPAAFGRVGFDARFEAYSPSELSAYFDFLRVRGQQWQRVMRGYGVIVLSAGQSTRLTAALAKLPGWRIAFRDHHGVVFVHRPSPAES